MKKVIVCLADGFEEIEAVGIIDVLRRADLPVTIVSIMSGREVTGAHGIQLKADALFGAVDFSGYDLLVLPGGMPGAANLREHKGLKEKILEFDRKGKLLGAICAAPMVFGNLGLLEGRSATCYPGFGEQLGNAKVTSEPVEVDGHIVTGRGPGLVFTFALKLVEKTCGKEKADAIAGQMLLMTW
jgi:4-methyl-5(b-hydroxyethyl)-thiazole monophosphate biosynthesis